MKKKNLLKFPENFLWGVSTSAYQIEGGIKNDWSEWEMKRIRERGLDSANFFAGISCDSYNRYKEDLQLINDLNCGAYRFGIEWSRIEPLEGEYDMNEIKHYRKILVEMRRKKIKSVVTIWHWTNPIWLSNKGGWSNDQVIAHFTAYSELLIKELGDLVDFWVTLNEPMIHVLNGYVINKFPPQNFFKLKKAKKVFDNLYQAHNKVYELFHQINPEVQVGFTQIINFIEPNKKWNLFDNLVSRIFKYFWNESFLEKTKNRLDYIGVDYYFHDRVSFWPPFKRNENKKVNDMGWEIYPEGIYHVAKFLEKYNLPIYIMENGLPDAEDRLRENFIKNHLVFLHKAIEEGVPVKGYFYWSLLDNFEWAAGFSARFGLYEVDRKTLNRTARKSAYYYGGICGNNSLKL